MKLIRSLAIAAILALAVTEPSLDAQAQSNKHVTTGEVKEVLAGDGTKKVFTLSFAPTGPAAVLIFENGLLQSEPEDYSISGKTITFTAAPQSTDKLIVKYVAEFNG